MSIANIGMASTTTTAVLSLLLCLAAPLQGGAAVTVTFGSEDGAELWGYIQVRPSKPLLCFLFVSAISLLL